MKARSAHAERFAHLSSVFLINCTSSWRSASDLEGSKSAGAFRGESRMIAPIIQKGGNTGRDHQDKHKYEYRE